MAPTAVHVALKVPSDLIERIEQYRDHLQSLVGSGIVLTRAEAIRGLVSKALDQFDAEQHPAAPVAADQEEAAAEARSALAKKKGGRPRR